MGYMQSVKIQVNGIYAICEDPDYWAIMQFVKIQIT